MLRIVIPLTEVFVEETSKFVISEGVVLEMEHSLISLSKWEAKWEKPFLETEKMTNEETTDYIRMMISGEIPPEEILNRLSRDNIREIQSYIGAKMTATRFSQKKEPAKSRDPITSELIYYWMISLGIPFECENWHLNRLMTLIQVCNIKNSPKKKMPRSEIVARQRELNAMRRRQAGSRG